MPQSSEPGPTTSVTRSLKLVAFGVAFTCLMLSNVTLAHEAEMRPISADASDVPAVDVIVKVQNEKKKVTDLIAQKSAHVAALSVAVSEEKRKRDDIDHQARIFDDSEESQTMKQDAANHDAACAGKAMQRAEYERC